MNKQLPQNNHQTLLPVAVRVGSCVFEQGSELSKLLDYLLGLSKYDDDVRNSISEVSKSPEFSRQRIEEALEAKKSFSEIRQELDDLDDLRFSQFLAMEDRIDKAEEGDGDEGDAGNDGHERG